MKTALISLVAASGLAIAQFDDIDRQRELEKQQRQIRDLQEQQDRMERDQQTKEIMDNAAKRQRVAALRSEEHMHPPTLENFKLQALDHSHALMEKLQKERDIAVKENQSIVNDFNALVEDYNKLLADAKAIEAERDQLLTENKVLSEKFEHLQQKEWDRRNMLLKASWKRVLKAPTAADDNSHCLKKLPRSIRSWQNLEAQSWSPQISNG